MQLIYLSRCLFVEVVVNIIDSFVCIDLIQSIILQHTSKIIYGLIKLVSFFISMIPSYPLITSNPFSFVINPKYSE